MQYLYSRTSLEVDYSQTFDQMLNAANLRWLAPGITAKHFPLKATGTQEITIILFSFEESPLFTEMNWGELVISSWSASAEIVKQHCRPCNITELLCLKREQPWVGKYFPVVALDSVWNGNIPYLAPNDGLALCWSILGWPENSRFAAVQNP